MLVTGISRAEMTVRVHNYSGAWLIYFRSK